MNTSREEKQANTLEETYCRGYHHGLDLAIGLISDLLLSGMPSNGVIDLCRAFEEGVIIPWRSSVDASRSAPPRFDLEECQRLLREIKGNQSS